MNNFGYRLKILRKMRGLSQEEFANLVGVSQKVVSSYERDYRTPGADKMPLIARVLETSLNYLYGRDEEKPPDAGLKKSTIWKIAEKLELLTDAEQQSVLHFVETVISDRKEKGESEVSL